MTLKPTQVYFLGAGPGDPELLTLKAKRILEESDVVIYSDSLVNPDICAFAKAGAEIYGSASLNLDEIVELIGKSVSEGKQVSRLHTGDPSLYGAIHEQMAALDQRGIAYQVVPGVSVVFAAAAALAAELTIPDLTQTLICTRVNGRSSTVPEREALASLATHGASLAIYLSISQAQQVQEDLSTGYSSDTPVAILHRLTWSDQEIVRCRLDKLAETVKAAGFLRQTLILVSPALAAPPTSASKLYAANFSHGFRTAPKTGHSCDSSQNDGQARLHAARNTSAHADSRSTAIIAMTRASTMLARRLAKDVDACVFIPKRFAQSGENAYSDSVITVARRAWKEHGALIFIAPVSIAVRAVGRLARDKHADPAVVALDESGKFVVSVLSGHLGGANDLARRIAALTGGQAVVTTASDVRGMPTIDLLAKQVGWTCEPNSAVTRVSAALLNGDPVCVYVEPGCDGSPLKEWAGLNWVKRVGDLTGYSAIVLSDRCDIDVDLSSTVLFRPRSLTIGIGCQRGVSAAAIENAVRHSFELANLALSSAACIATARVKAKEPGLLAFAEKFSLPLYFFEDAEIKALAGRAPFTPSAAREKLGLPGVAEPCAMLAAGAAGLLATKRAESGVTVAIAKVVNS